MKEKQKWYDAHLSHCRQVAYIKSRDEYEQLYRQSLDDPEAFWAKQAREYLTWEKEWDFVLRYDFKQAQIEWFGGGVLNAAFNCLDRHLPALKDKVAYYWEGDDPAEKRFVTYGELHARVNKMAAVLTSKGIAKGDRVVIYLPMIIELPVSMLACARIGAIHIVIFAGFSAETLANRIQDCDAQLVITADGTCRGGKPVALKNNVDEALKSCPCVRHVIVFDLAGLKPRLDADREVWWHEAAADSELPDFIKPEPMGAEDPLFILYTSGSTGSPKGLVHTHGGYLLYVAMTTRLVFDLKDHEIFWSTADIGWVTGHSYAVYGPLLNGFTSVLYEGIPSYPTFDRYWQIVAKYRVNKFYTAPTVIRALAKAGKEHVAKHDISCLKLLGTVGEPINQEAWRWYYHHIGRDWCPIVDTWWQTETGGHMLSPLPGVAPIKPGSCSGPFFGVEPIILDDEGEEIKFPDQEGVLCIRKPWPGMARTIYGDHERFKEIYFSQVPGMYFTGDGAKKDEDGFYCIIGRIDDVINVSGHRIGAAEIESALVLHEDVAEAAVIGFPHEIKGQGIYAFVTLNSGVPKSDDLKKDLRDMVCKEIGSIAAVDVIQWTDALPKTRSGKIMRRILKQIAASNFDDLGDTSTIADPAVVDKLIQERVEP